MLSTNTIKYLRSLHQRKYRQKYNKFIAEGTKIALEVIKSAPHLLSGIYALPDWIETHKAHIAIHQHLVSPVSSKELGRISTLRSPNQVLLELNPPDYVPDYSALQHSLAIYLDGIQDPGNLGTILRIADWFGIRQVLASPDSAHWDNPKVVQATMGAFLRVQYHKISIEKILDEEKNIQTIGAVMDGKDLFQFKPKPTGLLIMGQESKGISPETAAYLTHRISLPRPDVGGAESLNVGVACGIICGALLYDR